MYLPIPVNTAMNENITNLKLELKSTKNDNTDAQGYRAIGRALGAILYHHSPAAFMDGLQLGINDCKSEGGVLTQNQCRKDLKVIFPDQLKLPRI